MDQRLEHRFSIPPHGEVFGRDASGHSDRQQITSLGSYVFDVLETRRLLACKEQEIVQLRNYCRLELKNVMMREEDIADPDERREIEEKCARLDAHILSLRKKQKNLAVLHRAVTEIQHAFAEIQ